MIDWRSKLLLLVLFGVAFSCAYADVQPAQTPSPASGSKQSTAPVFKATTRLVIVNVVVTDKNNHPVTGMKASDFKLWDSGKPQKLAAFEAHTYTPPVAVPSIKLPPNQYTNFSTIQKDHALNIVLLDLLNSPKLDRIQARRGVLKFLTKLPPGHAMAMYVLGDSLRIVQPFTQSSDDLIAAAKELLENQTHQLVEEKLQSSQSEQAAYAGRMSTHNSDGASRLLQALGMEESYDIGYRAGVTVHAIGELGRTLNSYPGRKNVLWLSSDFPLWLNPEMSLPNSRNQIHDYESAVYLLGPMLASSQVAFYPVDIHGLSTYSIDASSPGEGMMGPSLNTAMADTLSRNWDKQDAMSDIARETGGQAFFNMNDVSAIMSRSIDAGGNYYTLAYTPENRNWNGKYRPIKVVLSRPDLKLTYRRGYLAVPEQQVAGENAQAILSHAMQPGMLPCTELMLRVQVLPPDRDHKEVRIDYAVDAHDIAFEDAADHRKRSYVEFIAIAWSKDKCLYEPQPGDGGLNRCADDALDITSETYTQEQYDEFLQTGFPAHQELKLSPGNYVLRLGVMDRSNQKIGTVEVPLTIAAEEAGK